MNDRIASITDVIKAFKIEQERLLLKTSEDFQFRAALKTQSAMLYSSNNVINAETDRSLVTDNLIAKLLNIDCILMPNSRLSKTHKQLWPQALVFNRSKNRAEVGQIESHGSLWKILPSKDKIPGSCVLLQTAEIGELPRYLGPGLDVVDLKADAALWSVSVVAAEADPSRGTIVRFELADTNIVMSTNRPTTVLCCETSPEVSSYCELLMGAAADKPDGEPVTIRTTEWEVVPDSWISSDLEFLEKYLN